MAEGREPDPYRTGVCRWWHLSAPSPELVEAVESGFLRRGSAVLDLGCGLGTEAGYLAGLGFRTVGVDLSRDATVGARASHPDAAFLQGDVLRLPFRAASFDAAIDRGCFHYVPTDRREVYATELGRMLKPSAPFLLRACLRSRGVRNDIDAAVIREVFRSWRVEQMVEVPIPSDARQLDALVVRLRPG